MDIFCIFASMMGYIYKIEFGNSCNFYIGSTSNFSNRKRSHISMLKNGIHHCIYLQNAANKLGLTNISINIIETCNIYEIEDREQYYLNLYYSKGVLYNSNSLAYNNRGYKWTDEQKAKQSERIRNVFKNEEIKNKVNLASKIALNKPECKLKMAESQKRRFSVPENVIKNGISIKKFHDANPGYMINAQAKRRKEVILVYNNGKRCYDHYKSSVEAGKILNISDSSIGSCCKDKTHSCGNLLIFIYPQNNNSVYIENKIKNAIKQKYNGRKRKVAKLNLNTLSVIKEFESATIAAKETGVSLGSVSDACNNNKTLKGYKWAYI